LSQAFDGAVLAIDLALALAKLLRQLLYLCLFGLYLTLMPLSEILQFVPVLRCHIVYMFFVLSFDRIDEVFF
jgi:hypothetical protein